MSQPALPGMAAPPILTPRLAFGLETIREHGPIPSPELGARLHARRGKHAADALCQWCSHEGRQVAYSLRRKGLAREKRGAGWVMADYVAPIEGHDPRTAEFPVGF